MKEAKINTIIFEFKCFGTNDQNKKILSEMTEGQIKDIYNKMNLVLVEKGLTIKQVDISLFYRD